MSRSSITRVCISPSSSIRTAIATIDGGAEKIALIVDRQRHLLDTITDGDIRRAMLAKLKLDEPVSRLRALKTHSLFPKPVTARAGTDPVKLISLMQANEIRQIPLLDAQRRVQALATLDALLPGVSLPLQAVVMAGGFGRRLHPLTKRMPKGLLPVGERPLLERTVEQLRQAGIRQVHFTTHYKSDMVAEHFGDGKNFGVDIAYVKEDQPLGTAGSLRKLEHSADPLLVVNGDIITTLDFRALLDFHRQHHADLTVAVRHHEWQVPYGVVELDGATVTGLVEKPYVRQFINAGMYLLEPSVCRLIPANGRYDMTDLISRLLAGKYHVVGFPVHEYWMDVGRPEDYHRAKHGSLAEVAG